jgi:hypothetical protein
MNDQGFEGIDWTEVPIEWKWPLKKTVDQDKRLHTHLKASEEAPRFTVAAMKY